MIRINTKCVNGHIQVISNVTGAACPVVVKAAQSPLLVSSDAESVEIDVESVSSDFMDLDSEDEVDKDLTLTLEKEEEEKEDEEEEEEEEEEEDVLVANYAREELVHSLPSCCTNMDIDRCVGELLASEYQRQKRVGILDRDSILDLQAKSCSLEDVSNEVVVDESEMQRESEVNIPLCNSFSCEFDRKDRSAISKHMLSSLSPRYRNANLP